MKIKGIGTDIIEIGRIREALDQKSFLERVFTPVEREYCLGKKDAVPFLAARFAAKEAVMKALGTGFQGLGWQDIELRNDELGKPHIELKGRALAIAGEQKIAEVQISVSHCRDYATAFAIAVIEGE